MLKKPRLTLLLIGLLQITANLGCDLNKNQRYKVIPEAEYQEQGLPRKIKTKTSLNLEKLLKETEEILTEESHKLKEEINISRLTNQVLLPLKDYVLNLNFMSTPSNLYNRADSGRMITPALIGIFNQALLSVYSINPEVIQKLTVLKDYKKLLLWDCKENTLGSCHFVKIFRSYAGPSISKIIKMIHDNEHEPKEKNRIVKVGFELKNGVLDSSLRLLFLEKIARLISDPKSEIKLNKRELKQESDLFANTLKININEFKKSSDFIPLIQSLKPWEMSRKKDLTLSSSMTQILELASQSLLFDREGNLTPYLKKNLIPDLRSRVDLSFEQGVDFIKANLLGLWKPKFEKFTENSNLGFSTQDLHTLTQIKNTGDVELYDSKSSKIIEHLLKGQEFVTSDYDEYFFLAHQLYHGHFNIDDAMAVWSGTQKNVDQFMSITEKLIKYQIVNNIVYTNTRMTEFYNNNSKTSILDLLSESDTEGHRVRKVWSQTKRKSQALQFFINKVVTPNLITQRSNSEKPDKISDENIKTQNRKVVYDRINASVNALGKNIKFLLTYPSTFPLLHIMASLELKETINRGFGSFQIESSTIIDQFFSGKFMPWFNFGHDSQNLDSTEIVYSYYYALATQIFKTYSGSNKVNFNHKEFFTTVIKKLIKSNEIEIDKKRREISDKLAFFKNNNQALTKICAEEKELQKKESQNLSEFLKTNPESSTDWISELEKVYLPRTFTKNEIDFTLLPTKIYDGTSMSNNKTGQYIDTVFSFASHEIFEKLRTDFRKNSLLIEVLLDTYSKFEKEEATNIQSFAKDQFSDFERIKTEYISNFFKEKNKIASCDWALLKRDKSIRQRLIFREVKYLGKLFEDIYAASKSLDNKNLSHLAVDHVIHDKIQNIRLEYSSYTQNSKFPQRYKENFGYNKLTPETFTSFPMDTTARLLSYLRELFPNEYEDVNIPADLKDEDIYKEAKSIPIHIDWSVDKATAKERFVSSGINAFATHIPWAKTFTPIETMLQKSKLLASIYKNGTFSGSTEVDCEDTGLNEKVKNESCFTVTAKEVLKHHRNLVDFVNIDAVDAKILELLKLEFTYKKEDQENIIKKNGEHKLHSFYDLAFKRVFSDASSLHDSEKIWFEQELVSYVSSVHKRKGSTFIFKYSEDIESLFREKYSSWIKHYFRKSLDLLMAIKEMHLIPESTPLTDLKYIYRTDFEAKNINFNDSAQPLTPYISELMLDKFLGVSEQLNNRTSQYFDKVIKANLLEVEKKVKEL